MMIKSVITLSGILLSSLLPAQPVLAESSVLMNFTGTLIERQPCEVLSTDKNIAVAFGDVTDRYLYLNNRTPGKSFELHLINCDIRFGNGVTATFRGSESGPLPGLLMPEGSSQASGIGIGIETGSGNALPINQQSNAQRIVNGNNIIALRAYVQGEPQAITTRTIALGMFTAIATFELAYE